MATPFIGEIRMLASNFAPDGWALCEGQLLSIAQNTALFSLLGTNYGGDGMTSFGVPDLRGRVPLHAGLAPDGSSNFTVGQSGGSETVTLTVDTLAAHNHVIGVSASAGTSVSASSGTAIGVPPTGAFGAVYNMAAMAAIAGGGQSHNNIQPYLAVTFVIALQGIYPTQD